MRFALLPVQSGQAPLQCRYANSAFKLLFKPNQKFASGDTYCYKLVTLFESLTRVYDVCLSILKKADEISLEFETAAGTTTSQKFEYPASMFDTDYQITVMQSQHQGFSINGSKDTTQVARAPKG